MGHDISHTQLRQKLAQLRMDVVAPAMVKLDNSGICTRTTDGSERQTMVPVCVPLAVHRHPLPL